MEASVSQTPSSLNAPAAAAAQQIAPVLECLDYTVLVLDPKGRIAHLNAAGERFLRQSRQRVLGRTAAEAFPDLFAGSVLDHRGVAAPAHFERYLLPIRAWADVHAFPSPTGLLVCVHDITERVVTERTLTSQHRVLEMITSGATLDDVLAAITAMIERQSPGDFCSILLLDKNGKRLHCAATGSLPVAYNAAIEGIEIGPDVGSCGTAAFTNERVVVADIENDPRWANHKHLALKHGLRACWSQPILSGDGHRVRGTVANYSGAVGQPAPHSLALLDSAVRLAQFALKQRRADEHARRQVLAFDNLYDGIVLTDDHGDITYWNPAAERMFGYARHEVLGRNVSLLHGAGHREADDRRLNDEILRAIGEHGRWRGEVEFTRKDGTVGVSERIVVPLLDDVGNLTATLAVNHDITERKRAESHLATEAAVTRVLADARTLDDSLPRLLEAVCVTAGWDTGSFWEVDPAEAGLLRCRAFWSAPDAGESLDPFRRQTRDTAFPAGAGLPGRVLASARPAWIRDIREDDNFPRKAVANACGLRGALAFPVFLDGRVIAVMEFFARAPRWRDEHLDPMLTVIGGQVGQFIQRVNAEAQLKTAKDAAEAASKAKDRFLAVLSHELRTPLSPALLIAISLANDEALPDDVRDDARTIQRNIQLQTRLIDDLLDVSRIENARLSLQTEPVDLHELIRDCLLICDADAAARDLHVIAELHASRQVVAGDPYRLRQVHCNVLKNAIKFTPPGGRITVRSEDASDAAVRVTITDTGIGGDPECLRKMFDPFEQAGRAQQSQGLGLGLTICKGIVEAHHGHISASSDGPDRGMTITISFPTTGEPAPTPTAAPDNTPAQLSAPLRILVVDDHAETLRAMARLLQRMEHRVITADCVKSALDAAEHNDFDLLISDVGLPDGTGTELIQELLKRKPVKGIAVTGFGMESDIQQTKNAGFVAHLTKPVDLDKLEQAIRETSPTPAP